MASSVIGQEKADPAVQLATRAGKETLNLACLSTVFCKKMVFFMPHNRFYWPSLFDEHG